MNKYDENKIDVFQSRYLRRIFKIRWQERITNKEVLKMAEIENLSEDVRIKEKMEIHSSHHEERTTK